MRRSKEKPVTEKPQKMNALKRAENLAGRNREMARWIADLSLSGSGAPKQEIRTREYLTGPPGAFIRTEKVEAKTWTSAVIPVRVLAPGKFLVALTETRQTAQGVRGSIAEAVVPQKTLDKAEPGQSGDEILDTEELLWHPTFWVAGSRASLITEPYDTFGIENDEIMSDKRFRIGSKRSYLDSVAGRIQGLDSKKQMIGSALITLPEAKALNNYLKGA